MRKSFKSDPPLAAGTYVAPGYEVIAHLSRAVAFDVYDVWSVERLCRCVAKALRPGPRGREGRRRELMLESDLLQVATHPHLVRAYEIQFVPDPVVILETLSGATLSHLIDSHDRPLAIGDLAVLGVQLCSATHYLHTKGYLHCDLKPENIVVQGGLAKVIDLGLAVPTGHHARGGTRAYMAPEQFQKETPLTAATDVWGIAATLYHAAVGSAPFEPSDHERHRASSEGEPFSLSEDEEYYEEYLESGEQGQEAWENDVLQLQGRASPLGAARPDLPGDFSALVDACLDPEPSGRPSLLALAIRLAELAPSGSVPLDALRRSAQPSS